jgi:hypothetical protein
MAVTQVDLRMVDLLAIPDFQTRESRTPCSENDDTYVNERVTQPTLTARSLSRLPREPMEEGWMGTAGGGIQELGKQCSGNNCGFGDALDSLTCWGHFRVAAHAYVHGIMDGGAWPKSLDEMRLFSLV